MLKTLNSIRDRIANSEITFCVVILAVIAAGFCCHS